MGDNYETKTIPKDSDGNIMVNEYREQTWHTQQNMLKQLKRINGTVEKHETRIKGMEDSIKVVKIGAWIISGLAGFVGVVIGIAAKFKQLI